MQASRSVHEITGSNISFASTNFFHLNLASVNSNQYIISNFCSCNFHSQYSCPHYSTCVPLMPGYNCSCPKGFTSIVDQTLRVVKCEDIDECKGTRKLCATGLLMTAVWPLLQIMYRHRSACPEQADCRNVDGSYECQCNPPLINVGVQVRLSSGEPTAYIFVWVISPGAYLCHVCTVFVSGLYFYRIVPRTRLALKPAMSTRFACNM